MIVDGLGSLRATVQMPSNGFGNFNVKTRGLLIGILITVLAAFTGCGKKQPAAPSAYEINGVKVDIPALQAAFVGSPFPDIQAAVNDTSSDLRYGQYMKAFHSLDKVASDPNLTEPQKKLVADVLDQIKL